MHLLQSHERTLARFIDVQQENCINEMCAETNEIDAYNSANCLSFRAKSVHESEVIKINSWSILHECSVH